MPTLAGFLREAFNLLDAVAALAVAAILFAPLLRQFGSVRGALMTGAALGIGAALQFATPVHIGPGVFLDMRAVPLALAGGFLGVAGALPATAIAAAARLWIGGAGAEAGAVALCLASGSGLAWRALVSGDRQRGIPALAGLGAISCLHILPVFALPGDIQAAAFLGPIPCLVVLNVAGAVAVGLIFEEARWTARTEAQQRAEAAEALPPLSGMQPAEPDPMVPLEATGGSAVAMAAGCEGCPTPAGSGCPTTAALFDRASNLMGPANPPIPRARKSA
jgi:diguanylate cyclase